MEREPGTLVTPDVTLVRPLSQGAMGNLWVGHHARLDAEVAVKFIAEKLVGDAGALARFQREARAAAQLRSPNVVRTYDYGMTDDRVPYIVMELLEGETLGERLRRGARLGVVDTVRVVRHVAGALGEAHECGIVHRDIKPDNIFLIRSDGPLWAKVLDFGMAKQATTRGGSIVTATGVIVGTPEYMSPEQVLGSKDIDHRSDLWSLGVVTYRVLFGDLPFSHDTPHGLIFAICEGQYRTPSSRDAPQVLDSWFDRCLAPPLDRRFQSAAELAIAFERAVAQAGTALETIGRTVVASGDTGSVTKLSEAPTVATALSTPTPAAGLPPSHGSLDPATLESARPDELAVGVSPGPPALDGDTRQSAAQGPVPPNFAPSDSDDGGTLECAAPSGPVRLAPPESLRDSAERISVEVAPPAAAVPPDRESDDAAVMVAASHASPDASGHAAAVPAAATNPSAAVQGAPGQPRLSPVPGHAQRVSAMPPTEPRGELPTLLPAQELRAQRARGRRLGWWAVLLIGTALAAIGVGVVLWLSPRLPVDDAASSASARPTAAEPTPTAEPRRGTTEVAQPVGSAAGSAGPVQPATGEGK